MFCGRSTVLYDLRASFGQDNAPALILLLCDHFAKNSTHIGIGSV